MLRVRSMAVALVLIVLGSFATGARAGTHAGAVLGSVKQVGGVKGCYTMLGSSEDGAGTCAMARAVHYGASVHISPDQDFVYVTDYSGQPHSGIAVFHRHADGSLNQLKGVNGCITTDGTTADSGATAVCRVGA